MKRWVMCAVLAGLLVFPGAALGQEEMAFNYDDYVLAIQELADLLDQAIYLAAAGFNPFGGQGRNIHLYGQGIVNLLYGPESLVYDPDNPYTVDAGSGIEPLYLSLRVGDWGGGADYVPEARGNEIWHALTTVNTFLSLAGEAALAAADRPVFSLVEPEELRRAYAYLLAARGGPEDIFLTGGVQTLVELFPSREVRIAPAVSIQDAIDRVPEGGTVYLPPGVYREALRITKSLTLEVEEPDLAEAFGEVVIQGAPWRSVVLVLSDDPIVVTLRNVVLADGARGLEVFGAGSVVLEDVEFRDCGVGIAASDTASVDLTGVLFRGGHTGLQVTQSASFRCIGADFIESETAVLLGAASDRESVLRDCTIQARPGDWQASVYVGSTRGIDRKEGLARLLIEDCRIHESKGPGIQLGYGALVRISNTSIVDSLGDGIALQGDAALELRNVSILRSGGLGLVAQTEECAGHPMHESFTGTIAGWGNTIPGPEEEGGNLEGGICPAEYEFLLDEAPSDEAATGSE